MPGIPRMRTLSDNPYHLAQEGSNGQTDGQTDKNRQTIAVTLCLRFAARVNKWEEEKDVEGVGGTTCNYMYHCT